MMIMGFLEKLTLKLMTIDELKTIWSKKGIENKIKESKDEDEQWSIIDCISCQGSVLENDWLFS